MPKQPLFSAALYQAKKVPFLTSPQAHLRKTQQTPMQEMEV